MSLNLAKYADQVAEWSYHGDGDDFFGYLSEWEARQPTPAKVSERRFKPVRTTTQLKNATKASEQETLVEELPELFDPEWEALNHEALVELGQMAREHQQPKRPQHITEQLHAYRLWRNVFVKYGSVPGYHVTPFLHALLLAQFPAAENLAEIAVIFGFDDCLPEDRKPAADRIAELRYKGFVSKFERDDVIADHDKVLADRDKAAAEREQIEAEQQVARELRQEGQQAAQKVAAKAVPRPAEAEKQATDQRREAERQSTQRQAEAARQAAYQQHEAERQQQAAQSRRREKRQQSYTYTEYWRVDVGSVSWGASSPPESLCSALNTLVRVGGKLINLCAEVFTEALDFEPR